LGISRPRAQASSASPAVPGCAFTKNMQVPETNLVSEAFTGAARQVNGRDSLDIWQTSDGGQHFQLSKRGALGIGVRRGGGRMKGPLLKWKVLAVIGLSFGAWGTTWGFAQLP
jgi:hypothetical protein